MNPAPSKYSRFLRKEGGGMNKKEGAG